MYTFFFHFLICWSQKAYVHRGLLGLKREELKALIKLLVLKRFQISNEAKLRNLLGFSGAYSVLLRAGLKPIWGLINADLS